MPASCPFPVKNHPSRQSQAAAMVAQYQMHETCPFCLSFSRQKGRGGECRPAEGSNTPENTQSKWPLESWADFCVLGTLGMWAHWAVATELVLLQQVAMHQPLQACPGPWGVLAQGRHSQFQWHICSSQATAHCWSNDVTCACKLLHWMELCWWPPVNTYTAVYPAGRECLSNLTGLSWCPSAQHHWVWTSPALCKPVQDPDQQQPHHNGPHYSDHCCIIWQVLAANLTSWSSSGVDFLLKHVY